MNDTQLLDRLSSAYATLEAPVPSAALAEILESGSVGASDDDRRGAVVVPLVRPQMRPRARHLVAAMVATFVLFSGLAVAGALPDPVQRQVSSVVSHLGIDLPSPDSGSGGAGATRPADGQDPGSNPGAGAATTTTGGGAGSTPVAGETSQTPGAPATTIPRGGSLGDVGDVVDGSGGTGGGTGATPPPPDTLLPPLTVPQLSLPPLTLPQLTLPPLTLPQLPLPLPLDLPLLGL